MRPHASLFCLFLAIAALSSAQVNVITNRNDVGRTGQNLNETILNTSNVNRNSFGKLFTRAVDAQIYAQPLIVSQLNIGGKVRNVVYVATMNDSLYAFDADDPNVTKPLWMDSFVNPPSVVAVPYLDLTSAGDIHPLVGILSTPVVDIGTNTIFVVTKSLEGDPNKDASYVQRLHALDLSTGAEKAHSPVTLAATLPGSGDGGTTVSYDGRIQNQRPGLLLLNGTIYIASASHGDGGSYHGWVLGYDETTLTLKSSYVSTPNGYKGGFWQSGEAPVVDPGGFMYLMTGNGLFDADPSLTNGTDYGDTFVKLDPSNLSVVDFFTPHNQTDLDTGDVDLGSSGPMLVPGTHFIVGGGKQGLMYVIDTTDMLHFSSGSTDIVHQEFQAASGELHGTTTYWNGPNGPTLYVWGEDDACYAFPWSNATDMVNTAGSLQGKDSGGSVIYPPGGSPGGILSISANQGKAGTGILWANRNYDGDANQTTVHGILHAFDATTMKELWNSRMNAYDDFGYLAKFCPPTIANGKVYMATFSNQLAVYGLEPAIVPPPVTGLKATAYLDTVTLDWTGAARASSYTIQRAVGSGAFTQLASSVPTTTYTDNRVYAGTTYYYKVAGVNKTGIGQYSITVAVTPTFPPSQLLASANSYTRSGANATTNYGGSTTLSTGQNAPDDIRRSYLTFNIAPIFTTIVNAQLWVYGSHSVSGGSASDSVYQVPPTWTEKGITYANQPALGTKLASQTVTSTPGYVKWDVTKYIQAQHWNNISTASFGIAMDSQPLDKGFDVFNSREATTNKPILVLTLGPPPVNFPGGFYGTPAMSLNGSASFNAQRLQVTNGGANEAGSAWFKTPVTVSSFHTEFSFQVINPNADGFTFCIQNDGLTSLGPVGGDLGFTGLSHSICVKFDLYNNAGEGNNSTGVYVDGAAPQVPAVDLTPSGIDLHSGRVMNVAISDTPNGGLLLTIVDPSTGARFTHQFSVNVATAIGNSTAYVGFTGGTGGLTCTTQIIGWVYGP